MVLLERQHGPSHRTNELQNHFTQVMKGTDTVSSFGMRMGRKRFIMELEQPIKNVTGIPESGVEVVGGRLRATALAHGLMLQARGRLVPRAAPGATRSIGRKRALSTTRVVSKQAVRKDEPPSRAQAHDHPLEVGTSGNSRLRTVFARCWSCSEWHSRVPKTFRKDTGGAWPEPANPNQGRDTLCSSKDLRGKCHSHVTSLESETPNRRHRSRQDAKAAHALGSAGGQFTAPILKERLLPWAYREH